MTPQEIILSCLCEKLVIANRNGMVWSSRAKKYLGCESSHGYLVCTLHFSGIRKQVKIHQVVWIAFNGTIPRGMIIDHIDRNPLNNSLENLRLVNAQGNSLNRRSYKGSNNPAAKIIRDTAEEIRRLHSLGISYSDLANSFSISKSLVAGIVRRELWV